MKQIFEFFGFLALAGESVTIYTLIACVSNSEPFPAWFPSAWYLLVFGTIAAVIGALVRLTMRRKRNRQKRLGMIQVEGRTGRVYLTR